MIVSGLGLPGTPTPAGPPGPATWAPAVTWAPSTNYVAGAPASTVIYANALYACTTSHTSGLAFDPTKWQSLLAAIPGPAAWMQPQAWASEATYLVGPPASVVTYSGSCYVCIAPHQAGATFDPTKFVQIAAGFAFDANGFVPLTQLPLTRGQGMRALAANATGGGTAWLQIVETALAGAHASTQDLTNIAYTDAFWPIGGAAWAFVQSALAAALGGFTNAQLAALQQQAITNR